VGGKDRVVETTLEVGGVTICTVRENGIPVSNLLTLNRLNSSLIRQGGKLNAVTVLFHSLIELVLKLAIVQFSP